MKLNNRWYVVWNNNQIFSKIYGYYLVPLWFAITFMTYIGNILFYHPAYIWGLKKWGETETCNHCFQSFDVVTATITYIRYVT